MWAPPGGIGGYSGPSIFSIEVQFRSPSEDFVIGEVLAELRAFSLFCKSGGPSRYCGVTLIKFENY